MSNNTNTDNLPASQEDLSSSTFSQISSFRRRSGSLSESQSRKRLREPIFMDSQIDENRLSSESAAGQSLDNGLKEAHIWGTDINVRTLMNSFELFFREFRSPDSDVAKYQRIIESIEENQIYSINIDCCDLHDFNPELYRQLVSYPQEVLPLFDAVVNKEYRRKCPEDQSEKQIQVKTFNLLHKKKSREVDPDDIDCLIAFQAMVTRSSAVIPDIKMGFFRCSRCCFETEVEIDRGRVQQPEFCGNSACKTKDSFVLMHNRCSYTDKQLVRVQETPESIPEGETPQSLDVFCYDDLINQVKPGDRVEITGVYRAVAVRVNKTRRNLKSLYRGYIDAIHFKKISKRGIGSFEPQAVQASQENKGSLPSQRFHSGREDELKLRNLANDPDIYQKLVNSLAPSIWEMEDVKKGILCQLFGGVKKKRKNESNFRSEINVLLCGDPGTSKSQLLQYVNKLSDRGIYTSGKGSSAVGLTASISRDPETRETVLESGALVLSDRGVCCIDEFDKMSDSARSILHEVMEQQTISIAKAGIVCSLNARTSVLAAANPKESRYDASMSVADNITLSPPLLSRFDLIYIVLDKPNERLDRNLARHLVSLYGLQRSKKNDDFFDAETLSAYIKLAKETVNPKISDEAAEALIKGYLEMRKAGRYRNKKIISATPRQLESLIRISEALARMRFSDVVLESDVDEAIRLMRVATQTAATDPKTGIINMDLITIGQNSLELKEKKANLDSIIEMFDDNPGSKPFSFWMIQFNSKMSKKLNYNQFKELLKQLESNGIVKCSSWQSSDPMFAALSA